MWQYPPRASSSPSISATPRPARSAWPQALAAQHGSAMTALHAETLDVPPYFTHDQLKTVERHRAQARREAERYLERFVRASAPDRRRSSLVDGPAVEAVLAAAARHDLVVLGTHGRRGPSRWWIGSVAERVVRDSPVPALVVRAEPAPTPGEQVFARPVAVAGPGVPRRGAQLRAGARGEFRRHAGREVRVVARRPDLRPGRHAHGRRDGAPPRQRLVRRHGGAAGQDLRAADAVCAEPRLKSGRKRL